MAVRRKQIRELAAKLLKDHNIKPGPVSVEKIAKALGIEINQGSVGPDISGFLLRDRKRKKVIIGVNVTHHPNRRRFTIAHEIGHYFLHEGELVHLNSMRGAFMIDMRNSKSSNGEDNDEREANLFAAELLMPAAFLADELRGHDFDLLSEDDDFLQKLAKKYGVSLQALTFRLANLGYIRT